jgi:hypothetical protein
MFNNPRVISETSVYFWFRVRRGGGETMEMGE